MTPPVVTPLAVAVAGHGGAGADRQVLDVVDTVRAGCWTWRALAVALAAARLLYVTDGGRWLWRWPRRGSGHAGVMRWPRLTLAVAGRGGRWSLREGAGTGRGWRVLDVVWQSPDVVLVVLHQRDRRRP